MSGGRRNVPTLPVPLLRDAVARETARLSLRQAAAQISLSPNGLRNFLNGSAPRSATRAKLERWLSSQDRKSTRLNSSHRTISYAVFCLKKKKKNKYTSRLTLQLRQMTFPA